MDKEHAKKSWQLYPQDPEKRALLARELHVPLAVAQILLNRGIKSVEEGEAFLKPSLSQLHSPFSMKDMGRAVEVIWRAINTGRRIAVYGDYDVDGITATALYALCWSSWEQMLPFIFPTAFRRIRFKQRGA